MNFGRFGAISKLPPGFQFQPTDEEIVFDYLAPKIFSYPLPASIIPEISISQYDPCRESADEEKYFFSNKEIEDRRNRATADGYWKSSGSDKIIQSRKWKPIVGMKKTFVFHKEKHQRASRTHWIMHEYRVTISTNYIKPRKNSKGCVIQIGSWVLCHVLKKKPSSTRTGANVDRPRYYDFTKSELEDTNSSSSSSGFSSSSSNCLTKVAFNAANGETSS